MDKNFSIAENENLSEVKVFYLEGPGRHLNIHVCKIIAGKTKKSFVAFPSLKLGYPQKRFVGYGETEQEALENCLQSIKNIPTKDLLGKA